MLKRIHKALWGLEMDIRERLFRIILVVGIIAVTTAIIQGLTLVTSDGLLWVYYIMLASFIVAFIFTFKLRKIDIAAIIIGVVVVVLALPFIFFRGGGINSGSAIWMTLGLFYVFLMFSGKKLAIFLILTVLIDVACYVYAFYNPDSIIELATRFEIHFDSLFAVLIVGITIGIISKFQIMVFQAERDISNKQRQELEVLSKTKDKFFASMSHEIRTPLNSIIGLNELILRENPSDTIKSYTENSKGASKMLLSLINDILDLSQLEINQMQLVEKEYNTFELFHDVVDMMHVAMTEKKLNFFVEIDKEMPSALIGDDRRIKQVIINLLTNAAKYTEKGSVTIRAGFEMLEDTEDGQPRIRLKIAVADTGIGIHKEEIPYLFNAFQRVDIKKTHKIEGTGLGLSIVKELMDLMGGEITVDSIYTQGSVFTITLDQVVANDAPMGEFAMEEDEEHANVYYNKTFEAPEARVLIVDDDELNLIITTKLLQDTKMAIDTACSPDEALRKTKKRVYNLIFVDYMMPGMDGGQMLKEIRKQENGLCRETPIVLLSANIYADKQNEYIRMGFDGLLEKPIDAERLEAEALKHLPEDLIEYRSATVDKTQGEQFISRILAKKSKKICVTTDSVCDLPPYVCEALGIKLINLYVKTEHGRFKDTTEIDLNNISLYMTESDSTAVSLSPLVEDYERFFAEALTEADEVIYLSMAKDAGKCYENASIAAKGFDHVHVIDSGHISSGQGLVVMHAARLAQENSTIYHIVEEIDIIRNRIHSSYILPSTQILYKKGFTDRITAKICDVFKFHPVLGTVNSRVTVLGVRTGSIEGAWSRYIRHHLRSRRINSDVIFVSHAGCTAKQLEFIRDEIQKCKQFKQVFFVEGSVATVCNAGLGSIGFAIYK